MTNPLNLVGHDFLVFYIVSFTASLAVAGFLRWQLRLPAGEPPPEAKDLDAGEVAYIAGGNSTAVEAAVASLVHRGVLELNPIDETVRPLARLPEGAALLEKRICGNMLETEGSTVRDLVRDAENNGIGRTGDRPEQLGLVLTAGQALLVRFVPFTATLLVPLLGVAKIFVGVSRGRPVGILMFLCIGSVILTVVVFTRRATRTRSGDRLISRLQEENAALKHVAGSDSPGLTSADLGLAVGLFGAAALSSTAFSGLRMVFDNLRVNKTSHGDHRFSGSGVSCGSSCGGGCGGGGCGGCGG